MKLKLFQFQTSQRPLLPELQNDKPPAKMGKNVIWRGCGRGDKISMKRAWYQLIGRFHQPRIKSSAVAISSAAMLLTEKNKNVAELAQNLFLTLHWVKLMSDLLRGISIFLELHLLRPPPSPDTGSNIGSLISGQWCTGVNVRWSRGAEKIEKEKMEAQRRWLDKRGRQEEREMHLAGREITDGRRQEDTDWIKGYGRRGGVCYSG